MDRETEKMNVKLLDGTSQEIELYKSISFREKALLMQKHFKNAKVVGNVINASGDLIFGLMEDYATKIWTANNTIKLDDIDDNKFMNYIQKKVEGFLPQEAKSSSEKSDN